MPKRARNTRSIDVAAHQGGATGGHRARSARRYTWVWQMNSTQPLTTRVESERSCSDPW